VLAPEVSIKTVRDFSCLNERLVWGISGRCRSCMDSNAMLSILGPPTSHICACFKLIWQTALCWKCGDVVDSGQCEWNTELSKPKKLKNGENARTCFALTSPWFFFK